MMLMWMMSENSFLTVIVSCGSNVGLWGCGVFFSVCGIGYKCKIKVRFPGLISTLYILFMMTLNSVQMCSININCLKTLSFESLVKCLNFVLEMYK